MQPDRTRAAQEALFCEATLAKSGDNVLLETLRGAETIKAWSHYPAGDVFDPESGAQWYYHCHDPQSEQEHGHFHCFVRPDGAKGPIHHLIAVGVDPYGKLVRLFSVNQWVVGDDWADAAKTVDLLERFDVQMGRPSYLVNRWLTAIIALYQEEIADLIRQRDEVVAGLSAVGPDAARADRTLEVASELTVDLSAKAKAILAN
ncbi:hypothetical protein PSQ90_02560 [Devosia rhodophyticola]|uniref:DUF6969 domain-containing protein n=1 Tax=Devosia rhodophyticola TaxID=3026423 RepID=A0ABY7YY99_9HYPH|nr:hypothetical protein [Devosia rhodophyticola]WDR06368.1 hypothetical protein PSQ90_02560 [Devosia rhodophyticola]